MKRSKCRVTLIVALLLSLQLAACGGGEGQSESTTAGGVIRVDGSSTVFPITEAVAEEFQRANPGVKVTVAFAGTGGGFKKFCNGETDMNDASRPIKAYDAGEGVACKAKAI